MEPKTQLERLEELERKIDHLKVSYEKYFRGIDRLEPWPERRDVERRVREFLRDPPRTTMARFRFANLRQRLTSLETYWNRVARQIEEGTHPLVLMRAKRRLGGARPEGTRTGDDVVAIDIDMDLELDGGLDLEALVNDALASLEDFDPSPASEPLVVLPPPPPKAPAPPPVAAAPKAPPPPPIAAAPKAPPPPPVAAARKAPPPPPPTTKKPG